MPREAGCNALPTSQHPLPVAARPRRYPISARCCATTLRLPERFFQRGDAQARRNSEWNIRACQPDYWEVRHFLSHNNVHRHIVTLHCAQTSCVPPLSFAASQTSRQAKTVSVSTLLIMSVETLQRWRIAPPARELSQSCMMTREAGCNALPTSQHPLPVAARPRRYPIPARCCSTLL